MTTKVVKAIQLVAIPLLIIVGMISCEGDIESVGVGIVDNGIFDTKEHSSNVLSYNQNDLEVKANRLSQYLLGIYKNDEIGELNASIVGQLTYLSSIDFGLDPSIDSVILNIPYQATREAEDTAEGYPKWELDSIYGDQDIEYNIIVSELKSYLNTLDPENPGEVLDYYTDESYLINSMPLYTGLFKPNKNDTITAIHWKEIIDEETMEYEIDTIKNPSGVPSIKLPLDPDFFTSNFLNNPDIFESQGAFVAFFNGLSIQVSKVNNEDRPSVMSLSMTTASMSIYYTNTKDEVRAKNVASFGFNGVTNNVYARDYTGSNAKPFLDNPNMVTGDTRLYLNGAAGSFSLIELFSEEDINEIRAKNWLINQANLYFYIDESSNQSILPERIFLYNYEDGHQVSDVLITGIGDFGLLENDADGNPYRYNIDITHYVSRILRDNDPIELKQMAIKVFNTTDAPSQLTDLIIQDYSWTPKAVVVHGNQSENVEKRLRLELVYTEKN